MSINLLKLVQENLQYPPLQTIDPTTQNTTGNTGEQLSKALNFSQSAIPAVLTALYKYSSTDEGATQILSKDYQTNWVDKIFDENKKGIIEKMVLPGEQTKENAFQQMNNIANEAVKLANENIKDKAGLQEIKTFFSNQVPNILPYLPPALHMGDLLNDSSLDDNTNKMEGPISSLMHSIGAAFSTPETDGDKTDKQ